MAYWQRTNSKRIKIYDSRGRYVPKAGLYEHLDLEPDHNVEAWVRDWETRTGNGKREVTPAPIDSHWAAMVEDYVLDMRQRSRHRREHGTARDHKKALTDRVLPYFLSACELPDPNDWPRKSPYLMQWLTEQGATTDNILKANSALAGFWEYLRGRQKILLGLGITTRAPVVEEKETPLPRLLQPEEVLAYLAKVDRLDIPNLRAPMTVEGLRRDLKLMALLGYFFSLRPQETFALRRVDFAAGSGAAELLACRVMSSHGLLLGERKLYGRLGVHVHRQRTQAGGFKKPKAYSVGWVSCFNEHAARALVTALMPFDKEALLFAYKPDRQYKWWRRYGIGAHSADDSMKPGTEKLDLKDLRRSSLLWLGHFTSMDLVVLKGHSRHKKEEMVLRYLRRPGERPDQGDELDLDA